MAKTYAWRWKYLDMFCSECGLMMKYKGLVRVNGIGTPEYVCETLDCANALKKWHLDTQHAVTLVADEPEAPGESGEAEVKP